MSDSATPMRALAQRLLERETTAGPSGADGLTRAADRLYRVLAGQLEPFIGADGFHALFARSVHQARREFRALEGVDIGLRPDGSVKALIDRVHEADAPRAEEIVVAVFGVLLDLLARFIGEDLAVRFVSRAWPEPRSPGPGQTAFDGEA